MLLHQLLHSILAQAKRRHTLQIYPTSYIQIQLQHLHATSYIHQMYLMTAAIHWPLDASDLAIAIITALSQLQRQIRLFTKGRRRRARQGEMTHRDRIATHVLFVFYPLSHVTLDTRIEQGSCGKCINNCITASLLSLPSHFRQAGLLSIERTEE